MSHFPIFGTSRSQTGCWPCLSIKRSTPVHCQGAFYVVPSLVFIINVFCLVYSVVRGCLVIDLIEPQNPFASVIEYPQSQRLLDDCHGGFGDYILEVKWYTNTNSDHISVQDTSEALLPYRKPTANGLFGNIQDYLNIRPAYCELSLRASGTSWRISRSESQTWMF